MNNFFDEVKSIMLLLAVAMFAFADDAYDYSATPSPSPEPDLYAAYNDTYDAYYDDEKDVELIHDAQCGDGFTGYMSIYVERNRTSLQEQANDACTFFQTRCNTSIVRLLRNSSMHSFVCGLDQAGRCNAARACAPSPPGSDIWAH